MMRLIIMHFYSHAREGRDAQPYMYPALKNNISTHTPARGVTLVSFKCEYLVKFLLTRPRGA